MSIYAKNENIHMLADKPVVLIVEDSKSVSMLLESFLSNLGYSDGFWN